MNKCKKILVLSLILWISIFISRVYANNSMVFENITTEQGLSQATVETIIQDSKGYIWMGTNDGLNRYNGNEILEFKHSENDEDTIASNYITALKEDDLGNLWVGTDHGLSRIDLKDYSISNYKYDDNNLPYNSINMFYTDDVGRLYIGTVNGIYIYDKYNDKLAEMEKVNKRLSNRDVYSMIKDKNGIIWAGTKEGLNIINKEKDTMDVFKYNGDDSRKWGKIYSMMIDDDNNLWVGTSESGLKIINIDSMELKSFNNKNEKRNLQSKSIRSILKAKDSSIWLATENGLSKYLGDGKFETYNSNDYDSNSLENDVVYTLMQDKTGLIWAGTYTGISKFDPNNKIILYRNDPFDQNSISSNVVMGTYEDDEGLLWIGTRDNGLNIIDRENDNITRISQGDTIYDLSTNAISTITGKGDIIWVGTRSGVNKIDKTNMTIEKYTKEDGLIEDNIKSLLLDSKNNLWIGTPSGLNVLDLDTGDIINLTENLKKSGVHETYIQSLYEDKEGVIWIGGYNSGGLIKLDTNKNNEITIYKDSTIESSLAVIRSMQEDKEGRLWIGSNHGLICFDKKTENFKVYTEADGLANNTVYGVLFDKEENIWMSTNNGISKFVVDENLFKNLNSTDGLQSNEFNAKSAYKCKNGEFIFGGIKGLNIFNPEDVFIEKNHEKIVFDSFEVQGKKYYEINNKVFKHNENFIRIKYFLPNYKLDSNRKYYYQILGISDKWVELKNNEAIFTDLEPGNYKFNIKYRNSDGKMSEISTVSFKVKTPIWKSTLARLMYVVLIGYWIYKNKNKVKQLDALVDKKTKELYKEMERNKVLYEKVIEAERSKNNYFINLSHELRTPLNVINSIEQLIRSLCNSNKEIGKDKLLEYMNITKSNTDRLLNLINNIIDTSKIENGRYKLNLDYHDIVYVVEEATLSLKESVESKGIELTVDTDVEQKIILCDNYDIERCIVNLVSNAQKFTSAGGYIFVNIHDLGDKVEITIEDNGIGIDSKYHESIFDRFNQVIDKHREEKGGSGLGLTITKQIIELHNGSIFVESEKNKGTKFTIILPTNN